MAIRSRLSRGGDSRAVEENEGGVGLFNVSERIKSFFGGSSQLVIDSGPDRGTCLTIIIIKGGQAGYESIDC
ncbi:hypothetical protein D3C81_2259930 [compost metagenome]